MLTTRKSAVALLIVGLVALFGPAPKARGAIVSVFSNDPTNTAAFDGLVSGTDLVNAGQPSFSSVVATTGNTVFPLSQINDGAAGTSGALWVGGNLPTTVTFTLNTAISVGGYDLTQIRSIAGFTGNGQAQSNQGFELLTKAVGAGSFVSHGQFDNVPFTPGSGMPAQASTMTTLTDSTGVIASGVEQVRLVLIDHGYSSGAWDGSFYIEVDMDGAPTAAAPVIPVSSYVYDGSGPGALPTSFPDSGGTELTDGLFPASTAYSDSRWVGFRDDPPAGPGGISHPQVTFDLGAVHELDHALITYLHSTTQAGGSITAPEEVLLSVSDDGASFSTPVSFAAEFDHSGGNEIRSALLDLSGFSGQHVRLDFHNSSQWTFLTEVSFTGSPAAAEIPEPATAVLLTLGLMGLVPRLRRRMGR